MGGNWNLFPTNRIQKMFSEIFPMGLTSVLGQLLSIDSYPLADFDEAKVPTGEAHMAMN